MFDFDAGKLLLIGVVALIVIGPKDMPRVLRQLGQAVAKLRRMAAEFQGQFMEAMREAELDGIREDMAKITDQTRIQSTFNPLETVRREFSEAMADRSASSEPTGAPPLQLSGLNEAAAAADDAGAPDFASAGTAPLADAPLAGEASAAPETEPPIEAPPLAEGPARAAGEAGMIETAAPRQISGI